MQYVYTSYMYISCAFVYSSYINTMCKSSCICTVWLIKGYQTVLQFLFSSWERVINNGWVPNHPHINSSAPSSPASASSSQLINNDRVLQHPHFSLTSPTSQAKWQWWSSPDTLNPSSSSYSQASKSQGLPRYEQCQSTIFPPFFNKVSKVNLHLDPSLMQYHSQAWTTTGFTSDSPPCCQCYLPFQLSDQKA
jgi:hypothetical protein